MLTTRTPQVREPLLDLAQGRIQVEPKPAVYGNRRGRKVAVYRDHTGSANEEKFPLWPCLDPDCSRLVRAKARVYCYPCKDSMEAQGGH